VKLKWLSTCLLKALSSNTSILKKKLIEATDHLMCKKQCKDTRNMKNQGNMLILKEHSNCSKTPKEKEINELPEK
jgi:hypothetical protein